MQIFFDDNIEEENNIIDVRDLIEGSEISYQKSINKYMVKVDSLKAIID